MSVYYGELDGYNQPTNEEMKEQEELRRRSSVTELNNEESEMSYDDQLLQNFADNVNEEEIPKSRGVAVEQKKRETKVYVANTFAAEQLCDKIFEVLDGDKISTTLKGDHFPVDTEDGNYTTINDGAFIHLYTVSPCRVVMKNNKSTISVEGFSREKTADEIEYFAEPFDRKDMINLIIANVETNSEYLAHLENELDGKKFVDPMTYVDTILISGDCIINQYNDKTIDFIVVKDAINTNFEAYSLGVG